MPVPLTQSEQDLLGQVARFAETRAQNGVYINKMVSKSLGVPVFLLVAIGEQALAVDQIVMGAAERDSVIETASAQNFIKGTGNGGG